MAGVIARPTRDCVHLVEEAAFVALRRPDVVPGKLLRDLVPGLH